MMNIEKIKTLIALASEYGACEEALKELKNVNTTEEYIKLDVDQQYTQWAMNFIPNISSSFFDQDFKNYILQNIQSIIAYAANQLKTPWTEAEDIIAEHARASLVYARDVIQGRWKKGEKAILLDSIESGALHCYIIDVLRESGALHCYIIDVLREPWPEAEDIIAENAYTSLAYSRDALCLPWEKGEEAISKNASCSYAYSRDVTKGRFEKGEDIISQYAFYALLYAKNIIKGRWKKGEMAIYRDLDSKCEYENFLRSINQLND